MRKGTIFAALICIFCSSFILHQSSAQELLLHDVAEVPPSETLQETFIKSSALPAIEKIITSLEEQGAPVPTELRELLELKKDPETFYIQAERYFGFNWQERLQKEASSLEKKSDVLMMRTRMYLSSLTANAERIAKNSPLDAKEVEALALNLLRQSQSMEEEEDRRAFFLALQDTYDQIFPKENGPSLSTFRAEVQTLLMDITDAIGILVKGGAVEKLQEELTELQTNLQAVQGTQELTAWLARFDAFAGKLLSYALPVEQKFVARDLQLLLTNVVEYIETLPEKSTLTDDILTEAQELLDQREDLSFDAFAKRVETLLLHMSSPMP